MTAPVPPQVLAHQSLYDFRCAASGPVGFKKVNKRKYEEIEAQAQAEDMEIQSSEAVPEITLPAKKQKYNTSGFAKVSGRPWKEPSVRANTLKTPTLATSWEKKMATKAADKIYKAARVKARTAYRENIEAEKKRREEVKARRQENRLKSEKVQKITNPRTLKWMLGSKKQKRKLRMADVP